MLEIIANRLGTRTLRYLVDQFATTSATDNAAAARTLVKRLTLPIIVQPVFFLPGKALLLLGGVRLTLPPLLLSTLDNGTSQCI